MKFHGLQDNLSHKEMKDLLLRMNYESMRPNYDNYVLRSWLNSKENGLRLIKFQLSAFSHYSQMRTC